MNSAYLNNITGTSAPLAAGETLTVPVYATNKGGILKVQGEVPFYKLENFDFIELSDSANGIAEIFQSSSGRVFVTGSVTYYSDNYFSTKTTTSYSAYAMFEYNGKLYGIVGGKLKFSIDDGETWTQIASISPTTTNSLIQIDDFILVGDGSGIYKSSSDLTTFTKKLTPSRDIIFSLFRSSSGRLFAGSGGTYGDVYVSDDNGETVSPPGSHYCGFVI